MFHFCLVYPHHYVFGRITLEPRVYSINNFGRFPSQPCLIKNCNYGRRNERGLNTDEKVLGKYENGQIIQHDKNMKDGIKVEGISLKTSSENWRSVLPAASRNRSKAFRNVNSSFFHNCKWNYEMCNLRKLWLWQNNTQSFTLFLLFIFYESFQFQSHRIRMTVD